MSNDMQNQTEDELLKTLNTVMVGSTASLEIHREFTRRAAAQNFLAANAAIKSAEAVERSAKAAERSADSFADTAKWTKRSAIGVALSVIIMALGVAFGK